MENGFIQLAMIVGKKKWGVMNIFLAFQFYFVFPFI